MKLAILLPLLALIAPAMNAQAPANPARAPLGSMVLDWNQLVPAPTKTGERRELFDGPTRTFANAEGHVTTLEPGQSPHPAHRHPDEELVIVKEGTIEVTINGRTQRAGPGSVFFYASEDLHGMRNVGTTRATYFVFRFVTPALAGPPAKAP
ncbi:MAG TPA: cupin domain-containing protein [Opitutaceae bacterium]|nr:cupin domain-containing protein [Opitutaceae bacterium]